MSAGADAARKRPTLGEAVRSAGARFKAAGVDTPEVDARRLVAHAAGVTRADLVTSPGQVLTADSIARIEAAVARRLAHEPVSRIVGQRLFHGLELEVTPATLDPRADTETVVDAALALLAECGGAAGATPRILDLGTGSGAIALALLQALPEATAVATDVDAAALDVAVRNATRHGLSGRLEVRHTCWLEGVTGPFDLVISNPPYIPRAAIADLEPEVVHYDPVPALDGGTDGLDAYRAIVPGAKALLAGGGWLVLEVGYDQAEAVAALCGINGLSVADAPRERFVDLGGHRRCVAATTIPLSEKKGLGIGAHSD